jgi:hypothetical protein
MEWDLMAVALVRKTLFGLELLAFYLVFDVLVLRGFKTREQIKNAPIAIAILLAGFALAVAQS